MISQLHYSPTVLQTPGSFRNSEVPSVTSSFGGSPDFRNKESFTLPAQADSTLLTPNSATNSPSAHLLGKFPSSYPTPPSFSTSLLQDTVEGARMYSTWGSGFDLNAPSSQAGSPLPTQPSVAPEFLNHYSNHGHDGRRTPGPPEPYLGHFVTTEHGSLSSTGPHSYYVGVPPVDHSTGHSAILRGHPQGVPEPRATSRSLPSASLLHHTVHSYDHRDGQADPNNYTRSINGSPRSSNTTQSGRVRKARRPKRQGSGTSKGISQDREQQGEYMNCRGQEVPPTLKSNCPDEERCIFESRWRHRKDKGQDMWDGIQEDYQQYFGRIPPVKETLQMKFKRARSKYIEWLPEDETIMREAWREMEDERYQTLLDKFIAKGGSRNMLLNPSDVEIKVVNDLKLEEGIYLQGFKADHNMDVRRRLKANPPKKRSSARATSQQQASIKMESVEDMNSQPEDDVIKQVHDARRPRGTPSDSSGSSQQQPAVGRWGHVAGIQGNALWETRQPLSSIMPPLMGQEAAPDPQRRGVGQSLPR